MLGHFDVTADSPSDQAAAQAFAKQHNVSFVSSEAVPEDSESSCTLHFSSGSLYLSWLDGKKQLKLELDFSAGAAAHRRKFGGGKGQLISKAVGIPSAKTPFTVLDCTAGQGGDAFVLASLGCRLVMLERSVVAHALLQNAIDRGLAYAKEHDSELLDVLSRMELHYGDAQKFITERYSPEGTVEPRFDVIYLDPMFPARKKSALVKKEMQIFHKLIGGDEDAASLLSFLRPIARYRVVVKRPKGAPHLNDEEPTFSLKGKSTRYDIYVNRSISSGT